MPRPRDTSRLVFRSWCDDDLPLARALWGDARVTALITRVPFDDDSIAQRLRDEIERERTLGFQYWPIFDKDGAHVGACGLKPKHPEKNVIELGFHLRPEQWGRGYATEASRSVIAVAFDELGAAALFAGHHPENTASRSTLLKLGFRYTHHELFPPTGLNHPAYLLEPAQPEW